MRRPHLTLSAAAAAILACCPTFVSAQATTTTAAPAAAAPPRTVTPSALKAADELLHLMHADEVLRSGTESAFDAQVKAQPLMAPFRATMQAWVDKYLTWNEFGPKLTQVYAEEYTEPELHDLIAFYKTPLGRKTASLSPVLTRRGAEVGAQIAEVHMAELQEMIQARVAELQKEGTLPPSPQQKQQQPPSAAPTTTKKP